MAKVFFTSDTHFNHFNIIKYCSRPFRSVEEMNREMIERWNAVVGEEDMVYHLGDFACGRVFDWPIIFRQLKGNKKILIRGNHDRNVKRMIDVGFSEVHSKLEWNGWLLQHSPMKTTQKLLCGHIHNKWQRLGNIINVSVDVWDFTPRTIEELLKAEESSWEYKCRYCGIILRKLENNSGHYDGKCCEFK